MIIGSINIRGLGGVVKRKYLKELVTKERLDFIAIQETKLESISDGLCWSIWGSEDCQWAFLPSSGNSGGILSIWNKSIASLKFSFTGMGFVGVCLEYGALRQECFVVNVYSSCDFSDKRRLLETLVLTKRSLGRGVWGVVGDFNAVLHQDERRGANLPNVSTPRSEVAGFGEFIRDMELIDLPILGRKFTWCHPNGISMSRIDRMMVSDDWLALWSNPSLWVLPRTVSDHCALVLRPNGVDWGPKPFRFNNHWLLHKDFHGVVENYWKNCNMSGWMAHILKEKLKGLKVVIRGWNRENYGVVDSKIEKCVEDIQVLDVKCELMGLSEDEVRLRKKIFADMWHLRFSKEAVISQRSRQTWLRDGDSNSRYFHASLKSRGKKNFISALFVDGVWLETPIAIRQATVNYFRARFSTINWPRPKLNGVEFPSLLDVDNQWLTRPFGMVEIEEVVKDCDGNKSPGPDGFNFNFVKEMWNCFKGEIRIMFDQFHGIASLPKGFSSLFCGFDP
jgi:hypothetical protein